MKNEIKEKPKFKIETVNEFIARGGKIKKIKDYSNGYKKFKWPSIKTLKKNETSNAA